MLRAPTCTELDVAQLDEAEGGEAGLESGCSRKHRPSPACRVIATMSFALGVLHVCAIPRMHVGLSIGSLLGIAAAPALDPHALAPFLQDVATPPERENPIANRNGTDPTEVRPRVELRYDDRGGQDNVDAHIGTVRIDIALADDVLLRSELPYAEVDSPGPPRESESGLGDSLVGLGWRVAGEDDFSVYLGANLILDTASDELLGSGQTILAPEIVTGFGLPGARSVFYPIYQHLLTVGDHDGRTAFNMSQFRTMIVTHWGRRWWTTLDPKLFVDWEARGQTGMTVEFEAGAMLSKHIGLWVRPGVGWFGDDMPGVYDWNLGFGLRFLF